MVHADGHESGEGEGLSKRLLNSEHLFLFIYIVKYI